MKVRLWGLGVLSALSLAGCNDDDNRYPSLSIESVEFTSTPAPATADEMAKTYSRSAVKITYRDGRVEEKPLAYNVLFSVKDPIAEANGQKHPRRPTAKSIPPVKCTTTKWNP